MIQTYINKLFATALLLLMAMPFVSAQINRPEQCIVFSPSVLNKGLIYEKEVVAVTKSPYGQNVNPGKKDYWVAYSDRANNKTYSKPSSSSKQYSSLAFNDKVIIATIQNGFALVIQDPKAEIWPNISNKAVVRGWVPMSNLLLWDSCPANDYGIYYKAVVCVNGSASNIKGDAKYKLERLYLNPDEQPSGRLTADMKFYFIMKKENGKALLAHEYTLAGSVSHMMLYGWADESSYIPWNQRVCLERTWDVRDAEYFADKKLWAKVYGTEKLLSNEKLVDVKFQKSTSAKSQNDPYRYRTDPYLLRFPILDGSTSNIYHCTGFMNPTDGSAPSGRSGLSEKIDKLNKTLENRQKVNIGIVIDGTQSMKEYFDAVQKAITEGVKYFDGKTVKVGVCIFRDMEDKVGGVSYICEPFPLTDPVNNKKLESFLKTGGVYGIKSSSKDLDMQESLYYGLKTALDKFDFKPQESNIMLVIGDCGDNGKMGVDESEIINRMIKSNVSFMGFQVRNDKREAFQEFNDQMLRMMLSVTQGRYDADRKVLTADEQKKSGVKVKAKEVRGGYDMSSSLSNDIYIGMYRNAATGKTMPAGELVSLMGNSFEKWNQSIQNLTDEIARLINNGDIILPGYGGMVNDDVIAEKAAIINVIGADVFKAVSSSKQLLALNGWSPKQDKASSRKFYKPVVFISSDELNTLIERLSPVYSVARKRSQSRTEYVDAMKALVRSLIPGITPQEINRKGYDEIMRLMSGLPELTGSMKGPSLQDIADPNVVKQGEYMSMVNNMVSKCQKLLECQADYEYKMRFPGIVYYWLPLEDLP